MVLQDTWIRVRKSVRGMSERKKIALFLVLMAPIVAGFYFVIDDYGSARSYFERILTSSVMEGLEYGDYDSMIHASYQSGFFHYPSDVAERFVEQDAQVFRVCAEANHVCSKDWRSAESVYAYVSPLSPGILDKWRKEAVASTKSPFVCKELYDTTITLSVPMYIFCINPDSGVGVFRRPS